MVESVGRLMWRIPKRRRIGMDHLAQALPELSPKERARIGKISCGVMARNIAEPLTLGQHLQPEDLQGMAEFAPGVRELLSAQREHGAVFVQGHFGSMEGFIGLLASFDLRPMTVFRLPTNYYVARALTAGREGWGVTLTTRKGAVKRMYSRLQDNGSVMIQMDVNARSGGIFVPWFGRLAATEPAAAWLTLRTGRPLIVAGCVRLPGGRNWLAEATLVRPASPPTKPDDDALKALTAEIHAALEGAIVRHPEQYFWIHDRYRTRPPGESDGQDRP